MPIRVVVLRPGSGGPLGLPFPVRALELAAIAGTRRLGVTLARARFGGVRGGHDARNVFRTGAAALSRAAMARIGVSGAARPGTAVPGAALADPTRSRATFPRTALAWTIGSMRRGPRPVGACATGCGVVFGVPPRTAAGMSRLPVRA